MSSRADVDAADLDLLTAVEALTQRRLRVPAAVAWERAHGTPPRGAEWVQMRLTVLRLERAGLVWTDPQLDVEVTEAGHELLAEHGAGG